MIGLEWILGGIVATLAAVVAAHRRGKAAERKQEPDKVALGYVDTRRRTDDADIVGDDPAAARNWLRNRDPDQR
ncbi:hypothetical protein [Falsirhodobacter deserti]|uniref:hypothetical protein n=1 Tax=Falsirhodobacter deserti TaxID=1365611 RepID=UPI000FE3A5E7|nr:hypothetical protein [Falsirhodobacter deserti]